VSVKKYGYALRAFLRFCLVTGEVERTSERRDPLASAVAARTAGIRSPPAATRSSFWPATSVTRPSRPQQAC